MVEAPGLGPVVEGTGGALDVVRGEVPLAEAAGDVAVLLEDARQAGAAPGLVGGVAREGAWVLGDGAEAHAVLVAAGEEGRARRRADRRHVEAVVGQAHLLDAREGRGPDGPAEGVRGAVAGVVDEDEQDVRCALRGLGAGDHEPVGDRIPQRAPGDATEGPVGDGQRAAVLDELAHGLCQRALERLRPLRLRLHERLGRRAGQGLLDRETLVRLEHGDDGRGAGLHGCAELVVEPLLHLVVGELAQDRAAGRADDGGRQQRRRRQADEEADRAAPLGARAADAVTRLLDGHVAGLVMRDEDDRLDTHLPGLDLFDERVEVRVRERRRSGTRPPGRWSAAWSCRSLLRRVHGAPGDRVGPGSVTRVERHSDDGHSPPHHPNRTMVTHAAPGRPGGTPASSRSRWPARGWERRSAARSSCATRAALRNVGSPAGGHR